MSDTQLEDVDIDLQYTRVIRKKLVDAITSDGKKMPEDIKDRSILLQALDGIDKAALTRKKIASDEGINNKQLVAAETIAQIFNTRNVKELAKGDVIDGEIKVLDESLPTAEIVHGEIIETPALDYDKFIGQFEKK